MIAGRWASLTLALSASVLLAYWIINSWFWLDVTKATTLWLGLFFFIALVMIVVTLVIETALRIFDWKPSRGSLRSKSHG